MRAKKRLMTAIVIGLGSLPLGSALADPCTTDDITNCELQVQAPVTYSGWDTKGWPYRCGGDHPYYWGLDSGYPDNYSANNHCFTISQNAVNEVGDGSKFDATFTNWCAKKETITVTLGCSSDPPPLKFPSAK
jgi:hypothetical protein